MFPPSHRGKFPSATTPLPVPFLFEKRGGGGDEPYSLCSDIPNLSSKHSEPSKIWVAKSLWIQPNEAKGFAQFVSRIYRCDATSVFIEMCDLTESEFDRCINPNTVEKLSMGLMHIRKLDGCLLTTEEILMKVPNANTIR